MPNRKPLPLLGTHVAGLAAIALGVIGLISADFAAVWQPVPDTVPHRAALAYLAAILFLIAGIAIQWRRTAPAAAVLLTILYFICSLLWLSRIIGFPRIFGSWSGFAEQFALATSGVVACLLLARRASALTRIARSLFGLCVIAFGIAHFTALPQTAAFVPLWIPPSQMFWAKATGVFHLLAGLAILTGIQARLAARLLTVMIAGFGLLVWLPALFSHPRDHFTWCANAVNLALLAAAWIIADSLRPL